MRLNRHKRNANQGGADDESSGGFRQREGQADAGFLLRVQDFRKPVAYDLKEIHTCYWIPRLIF